MREIDRSILDTNQVICDNLALLEKCEGMENVEDLYGLVCQNILAQLRNFVEYLMLKEQGETHDSSYENRTEIIRACSAIWLKPFHKGLQRATSHYTTDKSSSKHLMKKYIYNLFQIRSRVKELWNLDVLENLENLLQKEDSDSEEYYKKIAEVIEKPTSGRKVLEYDDRYYVQNIKPFHVNGNLYYAVTFTIANTFTSKFNRILAFTKHNIMDNYAVKFPSIYSDTINVHGIATPILIIDDWEIAIRPCELKNFHAIIFAGNVRDYSTASREYKALMKYIKVSGNSLANIVNSSNNDYAEIKKGIQKYASSTPIFSLLDRCRDIVRNNRLGKNTISYLLHIMRNDLIKKQYPHDGNGGSKLDNLHLSTSCFPFEKAPYRFSLRGHNPKKVHLLDCVSSQGREYEQLGKLLDERTDTNNQLFIPKEELPESTKRNIDTLITMHNNICWKEEPRIKEFLSHLYIHECVEDTTNIIQLLKDRAESPKRNDWALSRDSWLSKNREIIDDSEKLDCLEKLFQDSSVALIYGSAGTGKTTLLSYIASCLKDKKKLFVAHTNTAVDNMRRQEGINSDECVTIEKILNQRPMDKFDILFVDECSIVSNSKMKELLNTVTADLLVLAGDIYQIESIEFGNWFTIAKNLISNSIFELDFSYRTENEDLKRLWKNVRHFRPNNATDTSTIVEDLVMKGFSCTLDESIFCKNDEDEIILCLNYDGLYGINNINQLLQNRNPEEPIEWNLSVYKRGDPIIFDTDTGCSVLHNNSKGRILDIKLDKEQIIFDIQTEEEIGALEACEPIIDVLNSTSDGSAVIRLRIPKHKSDEDDTFSTVVPFHVAYATSIHKSQGLEYDSVKIIITDSVEEQITHDIFYTAITRARKNLQIYWNSDVQSSIMRRICPKDSQKDAQLLAELKGFEFRKKKLN